MNKQTCKIKRNIGVLLLKNNNYEEALNMWQEVKELEKELYGEDSLQVGKTFKIIGTIYIISEIFDEAQEYLEDAYKTVSYTHLTLPTILLVQISVVAVTLKKKTIKKTRGQRTNRHQSRCTVVHINV
eukprot:TRINITY_DN32008_c0_g1_i1.p1 TRINITY_DN32008_c0_g1~~TRINITY_DN32008_c0_g1_i1.p1  ORF type:complete len:128 (+),score=23.80 TRINITY_DN32008_c0_g1_i1:224-607(+)